MSSESDSPKSDSPKKQISIQSVLLIGICIVIIILWIMYLVGVLPNAVTSHVTFLFLTLISSYLVYNSFKQKVEELNKVEEKKD